MEEYCPPEVAAEKIILFQDDDTVVIEKDFEEFVMTPGGTVQATGTHGWRDQDGHPTHIVRRWIDDFLKSGQKKADQVRPSSPGFNRHRTFCNRMYLDTCDMLTFH